jgi:hypothetical protein
MAGSPIAEAKNGRPSNRRRRLDGTIHGIRRLGNLSVPFRLSPRWWGWLNPERVSIRQEVASTILEHRLAVFARFARLILLQKGNYRTSGFGPADGTSRISVRPRGCEGWFSAVPCS